LLRSPEHAELFVIEGPVFLDLMGRLPMFARNLSVVLAKRLETTTLKVPRASGKQLQGNLRFFDLATVIQTLIGSHQTGNLVVSQEQGKQKIAEIFFFRGNIARAKYKLAPATVMFAISKPRGVLLHERNVAEDEYDGHPMPAIAAHGVGPTPGCPMLRRVPDGGSSVTRRPSSNGTTPRPWARGAVWARRSAGATANDYRDIRGSYTSTVRLSRCWILSRFHSAGLNESARTDGQSSAARTASLPLSWTITKSRRVGCLWV
jgi:hypothetical protein